MFLQWIPWFLRMARPGEKITRKTIMMQNKMKELDLKERSSKSLLANVLDMDDDFRPSSTLPHAAHIHPHHPSHAQPPPPGATPTPGGGGPGAGGFMRVTSGMSNGKRKTDTTSMLARHVHLCWKITLTHILD